MQRPLTLHVPGIKRALRFQQYDLRFLVCRGAVLNAVRHDDELAGTNDDFALNTVLAHTHAHRAFHDEEQFVFDIVMVPDERPLKLHQLDVEVVEFSRDLGTLLVGEERELLGKVDFVDCHFHAPCDFARSRNKAAFGNVHHVIPWAETNSRSFDSDGGCSRRPRSG